MKKSKEILICILAIIMLMFTTTTVFATLDEGEDGPQLTDPGEDDDDNDNDNGNGNGNGSRVPVEYPGNEPTEEPNGKDQPTTGKNNTNGMPDTGLEDAPIIAIVICVVAASIGYTQIIKYNKY